MLDFGKTNDYSGSFTTLDFEKAFDSLKRDYLMKALKAFNFGPSFTSWIKTFYNNVLICVTNIGFSISFFELKRGVNQGDPLLPYLFIYNLKLLAFEVRNNKGIDSIFHFTLVSFSITFISFKFCRNAFEVPWTNLKYVHLKV